MTDEAPRSIEKIVWIDIETTGLNPEVDKILEIAVLITDKELNQLDFGVWVLQYRLDASSISIDPFVLDMHKKNNLWRECHNSGKDLRFVRQAIMDMFVKNDIYYQTARLGGSTVHFDRRFLAVHLPLVEQWVHYRHIDVSSIRQLMKWWAPEATPFDKIRSNHRAGRDIEETVEELRHYKRLFHGLYG